jgi:bacterioferritin-associated ferredoxin
MDKIICFCKTITEKTIQDAISNGAKTLTDIQKMTGACTGNQCKDLNPSGKCCSDDINKLLGNKTIITGCSCCGG